MLRKHIEMQGFSDNGELASIVGWMRFPQTMNLVVAIIGTYLASPTILGALACVYALAVVLPTHPWDYVYNILLRPFTG